METVKKIDIHLHLARNEESRGRLRLSTCREAADYFPRRGIEKGILLAGGGTLPQLPGNEECAAAAREDPAHFAWMCSPERLEPGTLARDLEGWKARGAVGVGELTCNLPLDHPILGELFRAAGELELPVTLHMSPQEGFGYGVVDRPGLPLLENCLQTYPDTRFVGHSGCFWSEISGDAPVTPKERNGYPTGPVLPGGRVPALLETYPNLYCDLSAGSGGGAITRDETWGLGFLEKFSHRLLFATDMLRVGEEYPLGPWLDRMADSGALSREAYRRICRENALLLYGL